MAGLLAGGTLTFTCSPSAEVAVKLGGKTLKGCGGIMGPRLAQSNWSLLPISARLVISERVALNEGVATTKVVKIAPVNTGILIEGFSFIV